MKHRRTLSLVLILAAAVSGALACRSEYPRGLYAEVTTNKGLIVMRLEFEKTPMTVANFVGLAEGTIDNAALPPGAFYFDGSKWHRVVPGHVIQCGMPKDGKVEGPGYQFPNEIDQTLNHDKEGMVGMANGGPHTNGSQWYITLAERSYLNGNYTVFGEVIQGLDVVKAIVQGDDVIGVKVVRIGRTAGQFRPTTASFKKMVAEAETRVAKETAERKAREEEMVGSQWPKAVAGEEGVRFIVEKEGAGKPAVPGGIVKVSYSGKTLLSGLTFVGTADAGKPYRGETPEPFEFEVGKTKLNPGLDAALAQMKKGEKRTLIVPDEQAYGRNGFYAKSRPNEKRFVIAPFSMLVYEVEVLDIKPPASVKK
jgi:cyclophilin family peptidyl-prolyl cis-trans isomerase